MEKGFRGLQVWKKGVDLAVYIYQKTKEGDFSKDYGLCDQIRRASVSIPSNIAEGDELGSNKQSIRHFYIAKGSSAEVLTQTIIAHKIGYVADETFHRIQTETTEISKMLSKLIDARSR